MKKISEVYVPAPEALNSLKKRKAEELTYEQKICLDFLKKHTKLNVSKSRELMEELQKIGRIDARQASMIINIMPKTKEDIKLIFLKERTIPRDNEIEKILEVVNKYAE
ncbi:MAG: DNA-directed RNA polymerase subunit F [Candidatus Aenigmarchaeota archaeon]|nr:DNA-directed RNA polymerase subunit F [Candidatus Aenigmarchaeota archaeon]